MRRHTQKYILVVALPGPWLLKKLHNFFSFGEKKCVLLREGVKKNLIVGLYVNGGKGGNPPSATKKKKIKTKD